MDKGKRGARPHTGLSSIVVYRSVVRQYNGAQVVVRRLPVCRRLVELRSTSQKLRSVATRCAQKLRWPFVHVNICRASLAGRKSVKSTFLRRQTVQTSRLQRQQTSPNISDRGSLQNLEAGGDPLPKPCFPLLPLLNLILLSFSPPLPQAQPGEHWVHMHPQGGEKMGSKFTGGRCKCTPGIECTSIGKARVQLFEETGEIWTMEVVNLVLLACVLRAATKTGRQLFRERKVHLKRKSWLCLCPLPSTLQQRIR